MAESVGFAGCFYMPNVIVGRYDFATSTGASEFAAGDLSDADLGSDGNDMTVRQVSCWSASLSPFERSEVAYTRITCSTFCVG